MFALLCHCPAFPFNGMQVNPGIETTRGAARFGLNIEVGLIPRLGHMFLVITVGVTCVSIYDYVYANWCYK